MLLCLYDSYGVSQPNRETFIIRPTRHAQQIWLSVEECQAVGEGSEEATEEEEATGDGEATQSNPEAPQKSSMFRKIFKR